MLFIHFLQDTPKGFVHMSHAGDALIHGQLGIVGKMLIMIFGEPGRVLSGTKECLDDTL